MDVPIKTTIFHGLAIKKSTISSLSTSPRAVRNCQGGESVDPDDDRESQGAGKPGARNLEKHRPRYG